MTKDISSFRNSKPDSQESTEQMSDPFQRSDWILDWISDQISDRIGDQIRCQIGCRIGCWIEFQIALISEY